MAGTVLGAGWLRGRNSVLGQLARAVSPVLERDHQSPDAELTARVLSATSDGYAQLVLTDADRFRPIACSPTHADICNGRHADRGRHGGHVAKHVPPRQSARCSLIARPGRC